jgi:hypothetical protein
VFRQPLAFGHADRLVHLWQVSQRSNQVAIPLAVARNWEASMRSFDGMALVLGAGSVNISNGPDAERAVGAMVSRSLFATLGISPIRGRTFSARRATRIDPTVALRAE